MSDFWFCLAVLVFLRWVRSVTWISFSLSILLSLLAVWFQFVHYNWIHPPVLAPRELFIWLSAVAWVTTAVGGRDPVWLVFLVPYLTSAAGLVGIVTGVALHVPLPLRGGEAEVEAYGISRHA